MIRLTPPAVVIVIAIVALSFILTRPSARIAPRKPGVTSISALGVRPVPAPSLPTPEMANPKGRRGVSANSHGEMEGEPSFLQGASPDQRKAYDQIGQAWALKGEDYEKECSLLLAALDLDPDDKVITNQQHRQDMRYGTYRRLAHLQVTLHRPDDALHTYGALLTRLPSPDPEIWVGIAEAWEAKGDRPRALAYFWTAAEEGYDAFYDGYSRQFLYDAIRRLAPDETERFAQLRKEVDKFGDWISYYHIAEYDKPVGDDPAPREVVPCLEKVVTALQSAKDALARSEAVSGKRDEEVHAKLEREYEEASTYLREQREYLREELEGR